MRAHAVVLVGALVLLGGCLGGAGLPGGATDGQTTQPTTAVDEEPVDDPTTGTESSDGDDGNVTATFVVEESENPTVTLEVANDSESRKEGLMHRQSLPENHGMVFVYGDADRRTFWMKNTYVPLDIIFVAPNGTVLNVEHAQPQPDVPESELDRYNSDGDAQYVVELERGFANRTGVGPGSELVFNESVPEAEDEGLL